MTTARPLLHMNFQKGGRVFPGNRFARDTVGTYVGADGHLKTAPAGVPRITHDPVSHERLGLIIEAGMSNELQNSEDFSGTGWVITNASLTAEGIAAPDNSYSTPTMYLTYGAVGQLSAYYYNTANQPVCFSTYFKKKAGPGWVYMDIATGGAGTSAVAYFNLNTGEVGTADAEILAKIEPGPNGWYRCSVSATVSAGDGSERWVRFGMAEGDLDKGGVAGDSFYMWGAQVELNRTHPTSYIKAVGGSAARDGDALALVQGTDLGDWLELTEGTILLDYTLLSPYVNSGHGLSITSGTNLNSYGPAFIYSGGARNWRVREGNVNSVFEAYASSLEYSPARYLTVMSVKDGVAAYFATDEGDALTGVPELSAAVDRWLFHNGVNAIIHRFSYWPRALTQAEITDLTHR